MSLVFAYGMNLDPEYMPKCHEVGPATLRDWTLEFRRYANIKPAPGEKVWGALWELDQRALERIDRREGFRGDGHPLNFYDRIAVTVDNGDEQVQCLVYAMQGEKDEVYPPSEHYLETILWGYKHFGLPTEWLWAAVRKACRGEVEFERLRQIATRITREEAEGHA